MGAWSDSARRANPDEEFVTHQAGMAWLEGCATIEDWGCGMGYARQFAGNAAYKGIDGSPGEFVDVVDDLRTRSSSPDGILMRHVIEHNVDWHQVLTSAVASFRNRMSLVIFTPFSDETQVIPGTEGNMVPDISFAKGDLTAFFPGLLDHEASFKTRTQYGAEHIFFLARPGVEHMHRDLGEPEAETRAAA
jgi:hypothetical protein